MLVIKYILAKSYKLDTLVFDEIDLGVSGEIASLMGDMMKEIDFLSCTKKWVILYNFRANHLYLKNNWLSLKTLDTL